MTEDQHQRLLQLLSQPTAPFREQHVIGHLSTLLEYSGVPFFQDPIGNLVLGVDSARAYRRVLRERTSEPLRLFVAHMDHPGFHGMRWLAPNRLAVRWHGGSPLKHLAGTRMRVVSDEGIIGSGRLGKVVLAASGWSIDTAEIRVDFDTPAARPRARALYGGFDFRAPVWETKGKIYCPAADDLAGVFAIIETACALWRRRRGRPQRRPWRHRPFLGLLTRAEEVGFVGAVGHLELGWLQERRRPIVGISLEASRTLPGAQIGNGPVVRLGDRRTVFNADGLRVLSEVAQTTLPGRHQRRIMDGGSCEATAMTAWGIPAIGISVPLGNYHNQGVEGGPDCRGPGGPAPEFVSRDDISGLLELCTALMSAKLPWQDPWAEQRSALRKNRDRLQRLL
ncbi:MAG: hypothetical protein LBV36_00355 [Chromatiales bacterium]|nr:hypothetical protein [Chromatiales bacterium]